MFKHFYHHLRQAVRTALIALLANKGRSFLTMLGIIIGVGAVILIVAVGAGAQSLILAQVKSLGTDLIGVLPGASEEGGPPSSAMGIAVTTLTLDDAKAIADPHKAPGIRSVVAYTKSVANTEWRTNSYQANLSGTTVEYLEVEGGEVDTGRFFTKEEEGNMARVAVLGSVVKEELFGDSDAVGARIKIKKHSFEVIGVMKERGTVAFQDYDDQILLPISTVQKLIAGVNHLGFLRAKVDQSASVEEAIADVKRTLREQHGIDDQSGAEDDFTVRSAQEALDMITTITNALRFFLAAMAALSLIVGGIGIMNIMLVAVRERTREIGLRKAVGASDANIRNQFLIEAASITLLGGAVGIAGGAFLAFLVAVVVHALEYDWEYRVSFLSIALGLGVALAVGLVFGLYPARKASRLMPVEALRYE